MTEEEINLFITKSVEELSSKTIQDATPHQVKESFIKSLSSYFETPTLDELGIRVICDETNNSEQDKTERKLNLIVTLPRWLSDLMTNVERN